MLVDQCSGVAAADSLHVAVGDCEGYSVRVYRPVSTDRLYHYQDSNCYAEKPSEPDHMDPETFRFEHETLDTAQVPPHSIEDIEQSHYRKLKPGSSAGIGYRGSFHDSRENHERNKHAEEEMEQHPERFPKGLFGVEVEQSESVAARFAITFHLWHYADALYTVLCVLIGPLDEIKGSSKR